MRKGLLYCQGGDRAVEEGGSRMCSTAQRAE